LGKLADKVVANSLQTQGDLFHDLQYGCRKGRSGSDAMMQNISKVERGLKEGKRVTLLGKDVVSAFNNLRREGMLESLERAGVPKATRDYVSAFLEPRAFQISWDNEPRGEGRMNQGTPQGSPLSPVLWLIYIARSLKEAERRIKAMPAFLDPPRRSERL